MVAAAGMFKLRKLKHNHKMTGLFLFSSSILLNSQPSYYESIAVMRNEPLERPTNGVMIRTGFYMLFAGGVWLWVAGRGSIPLLRIKV